MNVFVCQSAFYLSNNDTIKCDFGLSLKEHHYLSVGDNFFGCSSFNNHAVYSKCTYGFNPQPFTDVDGHIYTFVGSDSVNTLSNRIDADTFQVMTIANENMVVLNNLTISDISLITGVTVSILLSAFVFRMIRKMLWY